MSDDRNPAFDPNTVHVEGVRDEPQTLVEFILDRLAEDEAVALAVHPEGEPKSGAPVFTSLSEPTGTVEMSSARVLAQCVAIRLVAALHSERMGGANSDGCYECGDPDPCPTLRALAGIWRDHDEWRP